MQVIKKEIQNSNNLTKCYSKDYGEKVLLRYLKQDNLHKQSNMLVIFSIDNLGKIASEYGKICASDILFQINKIIRTECDYNDIIVFFQNNEFIVLFRKKSASTIKVIVHKIFNKIHNLYSSRSEGCIITCSCGIMETTNFVEYNDFKNILAKTLIIAKNKGGNYIATDTEVYEARDEVFEMIDYDKYKDTSVVNEAKLIDVCSFAFGVFTQNLDMTKAINIILAKIAQDFKIDRIVILHSDTKQEILEIKYQYAKKELNLFTKTLYNIPEQYLEKLFEIIQDEQSEVFHNDATPQIIKELFRLDSIQSQIHNNIYDGNKYVCSIFYDVIKEYHHFSPSELKTLKEVSNIIGINIIKNRAKKACQMKTEFLTRMSHEIRNPLNALTGMINIAIYDLNDKNKVQDCLNKMRDTAKYLALIVNDIIDMAKIERGMIVIREEPFKLTETVNEVISTVQYLSDSKNIDLILDMNVCDKYLLGDSLKLAQILINLISNAIKFTPNGGTITVGVNETENQDNLSKCEFYVKDTGIGIDATNVNKVFSAFIQENSHIEQTFGGSGLGLTISSDIVRMMGGKLQAVNNIDVGTTFAFSLTFKQEINKVDSSVSKEIKKDSYEFLKGKKILLVEDDILNSEVCKALLERVGCIVETAKNGFIAVKLFSESEIDHFDIILMDLQMPIMGGFQASLQIRGLKRMDANKIPIIALTANVFEDSFKILSKHKMNGYICKPIDFNLMYNEIIKVIKETRS